MFPVGGVLLAPEGGAPVPEVGGVAGSAADGVDVVPDGGVAAAPPFGAAELPVAGMAGVALEGGAVTWSDGVVAISAALPEDLCQQPVRANGSIMALRRI